MNVTRPIILTAAGALAGAGVLVVAAVAAWWLLGQDPVTAPPPPTFAGSVACAGCHADEYGRWQKSQHAMAMQPAADETVLGRFDDNAFTDSNVTSRFSRRDGRFFVVTDGPDGKPADFELTHTFGIYPLQQYLVPFRDGRRQALSIAWDARPQVAGGQRWFHLYPGQARKAGDPLHWTGIDQTWNYQCADCHSTNLRKNFDTATGRYTTTWSEISVGCEACHGPASNHLAWAGKKDGWRELEGTKGLSNRLDERRGISWVADKAAIGGTALRSAPRAGAREIDTCARCHARRGQYADAIHAGDNWLDAFRPALLEPGLYYPDGQQRDEVYTWGSFLQSRMHAAGVTCADCHDPHSEQLRAPGNGVCAQCHMPAVFDTAAHHHHEPGSKGAACAACHMPTTTYMGIDARHDHSLRIPRPDRSVTLGTPNACNACHEDRDAGWAAAAVARWYPERKPGFQGFAEAFAAADRGDPSSVEALLRLIGDPKEPAIVRASSIARAQAYLSPAVAEALKRSLADPDALVRATAAEALTGADAGLRAEQLTPLLADPVRLVRMAAARSIAGEPEGRLLPDERGKFTSALEEWSAGQRYNADRPESLTNLGTLQFERGVPQEAIASYRAALDRDPTFVQAAVNMADVQRSVGDEASAERTLREAVASSPRTAAAHYALGLTLIREGRKAEALVELKEAHALEERNARFAYVYAVALHDSGDPAGAVALLRKALGSQPYDRDLQGALAAYEGKRP